MKQMLVLVFVLASLPAYAAGSADIGFIQLLAGKDAATVSDAVLLFSAAQGGEAKDFASARDFLIGKGILKEREYAADALLGRGLLAGMTARALGLRGSLLFRITGADRYACSACLADGIMAGEISEFDVISGPELIEIIGALSSRGGGHE